MRPLLLGSLMLVLAACAQGETTQQAASSTTVVAPQVARDAQPSPAPSAPSMPATPAPRSLPSCTWARVVTVIDGDTIDVDLPGGRERVRYIGVDTPETKDPRTGVQPYGPEASAFNTQLVGGKEVCLERDITERDRYGRLLRYVWLSDGTFVNEALLLAGLAVISTYPPDVKYVDSIYLPAQQAAQAAGRGIWSTSAPPASATDTPSARPGDGCDPAYPDVCIPPPPPDLDCGQITPRRFRVLPPDPHRLDSDKDGIGCEGS